MSEPNPKYPGEWRPMSKSISQPQPNRLTYAQAVFIEWFKSIHPKLHTHVYFEPDENGVVKPRERDRDVKIDPQPENPRPPDIKNILIEMNINRARILYITSFNTGITLTHASND